MLSLISLGKIESIKRPSLFLSFVLWTPDTEEGHTNTFRYFAKLGNFSKKTNPKEAPTIGGVDRDRTDDLIIANDTLYQLSYNPIQSQWKSNRINEGKKINLYI